MVSCPYYPIKCFIKKKSRTECPERCQKRAELTIKLKNLNPEKKSLLPFVRK